MQLDTWGLSEHIYEQYDAGLWPRTTLECFGLIRFARGPIYCHYLVWLGEEMDHFVASGLYPLEFKKQFAVYAHRLIILGFQTHQIAAQTDY